jgi:hypothetical protein
MGRSIGFGRLVDSCVSLHEPLEKAEDRYLALGVKSLGGRVAGSLILGEARGDTGGA